MKVFRVMDTIESYYIVYNLVAANSKEEALEIIRKEATDSLYFVIGDIAEIPGLNYDSKEPSIILAVGEHL